MTSTTLFKKIFEQLETQATPRWLKIGSLMYRFSYEEQNKIEKSVGVLRKKVHETWEKDSHKNIMIYKPEQLFQYAFAHVLFKDTELLRPKGRRFLDRSKNFSASSRLH